MTGDAPIISGSTADPSFELKPLGGLRHSVIGNGPRNHLQNMVVVERFANVVKGPFLDGANGHLDGSECRQEHQGRTQPMGDFEVEHLQTIRAGHFDVAEHHFRRPLPPERHAGQCRYPPC
jgi:hypothetical protein